MLVDEQGQLATDSQSTCPVVSVVIACRNERKHISPLLDSVLQQDLGGTPYEIIIADGMSDDGAREILESYRDRHPEIRIVDNSAKIVSTGLNTAITMAHGDVIIRLDAHSEYAPDYIRTCLNELDRTGAQNVGGPARTRADGLLGKALAAAYHSWFACGGARFHDVGYEGYVDTVPYGCWRKSTLERLGLFDESLVRNQDDELNLRLIRAGGKIWQSPKIVSWYQPRTMLSGLFRQYFQYGFWKVAVIRKHGRPASWRHLVPALFVLANLALFFAWILHVVTNGAIFSRAVTGWGILAAAYAAAALIATTFAAKRHGWQTLPFLPVIFAAYHISYGLGFLVGLLYHRTAADAVGPASLFTEITR